MSSFKGIDFKECFDLTWKLNKRRERRFNNWYRDGNEKMGQNKQNNDTFLEWIK